MIGTLFRVLLGFVLACLAAAAVKVGFVLGPSDVFQLPEDRMWDELGSAGMLTLAVATQSAVFAAPFALVAVALSEWIGLRNVFYHVIAALFITMAGFLSLHLSEPGAGPTIVNTYAMTAYPVAGLVAGLVYWLIAGRSAGGPVDYVEDVPTTQPPLASTRSAAAGPPARAPGPAASVPPAGRA